MSDTEGTIHATVSGAYGIITQMSGEGWIELTFQNPPANAQGLYQIDEGPEWLPIPDAGIAIPASAGMFLKIQTQQEGLQAKTCDRIEPETQEVATLRFSWPPSTNNPSVVIEVRETTIHED